jgi:hypothetical protein
MVVGFYTSFLYRYFDIKYKVISLCLFFFSSTFDDDCFMWFFSPLIRVVIIFMACVKRELKIGTFCSINEIFARRPGLVISVVGGLAENWFEFFFVWLFDLAANELSLPANYVHLNTSNSETFKM